MAKKTKKTDLGKTVFDFRTIKTVEDAMKKCNCSTDQILNTDNIPEKFKKSIMSGFLLMIVFNAINDGWEPDFSNQNQYKYFPWPWILSSGFGFGGSNCSCSLAHSAVGSRLCTNTSEKAIYILKQFDDLWKSWLLNVDSK